MPSHLTRRRLISSASGAVAAGALAPIGLGGLAMAEDAKVRMTTGLRAASQGMSWLGAEAGLFKKQGLDVSFPGLEVGGPEAAAGLMRGDWEFCHTGTLPVAEGVLNGGDIVALARNALPHRSQFLALRRDLTSPGDLAGKRVGVLTDAYSGQTGVQTRLTVEKAGATATYVGLGTFGKIYAALAAGEIDAGAVPIHLRFSGVRQYGWNVFELSGFEADVPSVFATTRKLIATNRDLVMRVMRGYVEAIHAFKTQPDVFVPLLQRFLNIADRKAAEDLYAFYVPLFPPTPRLSLSAGMPAVRTTFAKKYLAAQKLEETDFSDSSFIDELDNSGFIKGLYAGDARR